MASERTLFDAPWIDRTLDRIAREILASFPERKDLAIVGLRSRGVHLAGRLSRKLEATGLEVSRGSLDITLYRDDLGTLSPHPIVKKTELPPLDDRRVILVDDVIHTGRTFRAALDALMDFGRPRCVMTVALIDRGNRELPITADFVGSTVEVGKAADVQVLLQEEDGREGVVLRGGDV